MDPETEQNTAEERRNQQVDNAIRAIQEKKPVQEIDFTIHTMEDNTQVNTMERVCKGAFASSIVLSSLGAVAYLEELSVATQALHVLDRQLTT